jgi:ZIP family zinc transporter
MNLPTRAIASAPGWLGGKPAAVLRLSLGAIITAGGLVFLLGQLGSALFHWQAGLPSAQAAALHAGLIAALATALGALPALFMKKSISDRSRNAMLGFSAGVMLAASAFSLLLPAIDYGAQLLGDRPSATLLAALALAAGVAGMLLIERQVPHSHEAEDTGSVERRGVLLMVLAIAIHNFPEGLAIGAAISGGGQAAGQSVTWAIALQDLPEGLVVAVSLAAVGMSRWLAFAIGAASGLAEPVAAALSAQVIGASPVLYPIGLAVAAGAMLFVVSHEIIPGTHRRGGGESVATLGLTLGFVAMLVIDSSFV